MERLRDAGPVIYLDVPLEVLRERVRAQPDRGIAFAPGQDLDDVYRERKPLYEEFADITIACDELSAEAIARQIVAGL